MILLGPPGLGKLMWPWRWRKRPFSPDSCLLYDRPRSGNRSRARLPGRTADRRLRIYLAPRSSSSMEWGICRWTIWARPSSFSLSAPGYEKGSIILIFNESYGQWGSIFGDPIIATAILDRLLHHSTTVNIRGDSYRLKERRKAGLLPSGKRTSKDLPLSPVATASRPSFRLRNERVPGSSIGSLANRRCLVIPRTDYGQGCSVPTSIYVVNLINGICLRLVVLFPPLHFSLITLHGC